VRWEESDGWDDGIIGSVDPYSPHRAVRSGGFGSNRLAYSPHRADCTGLRAIIIIVEVQRLQSHVYYTMLTTWAGCQVRGESYSR
jgi:hypothetical protein